MEENFAGGKQIIQLRLTANIRFGITYTSCIFYRNQDSQLYRGSKFAILIGIRLFRKNTAGDPGIAIEKRLTI